MLRSGFVTLLVLSTAYCNINLYGASVDDDLMNLFHGPEKQSSFLDWILKKVKPSTKACSSSQMMQMQTCYTNMLGNFNMSTPPFPSYWDFANMRGNYLLYNGAPGMVRVCNWQHDLENCMSSLQDCIDTDVYMTVLNQNETAYARDWFTEFYVLQYECGPGFRDLMRNFYCLESVDQFHTDDIIDCIYTLINATNMPDSSCDDYNNYIMCLVNVYLPECGPGSQHFVCSVERVAVAVNVPDCEPQLINCDNMGMSSTMMTMMPDQARRINLRRILERQAKWKHLPGH